MQCRGRRSGGVAQGRVQRSGVDRLDGQIAAGPQHGVGDVGTCTRRPLIADPGAQQGVQRQEQDVLRSPPERVERQRHPRGALARPRDAVECGVDAGIVVRADGQVSAGLQSALRHHHSGIGQHEVGDDHRVDGQVRALAEGAAAGRRDDALGTGLQVGSRRGCHHEIGIDGAAPHHLAPHHRGRGAATQVVEDDQPTDRSRARVGEIQVRDGRRRGVGRDAYPARGVEEVLDREVGQVPAEGDHRVSGRRHGADELVDTARDPSGRVTAGHAHQGAGLDRLLARLRRVVVAIDHLADQAAQEAGALAVRGAEYRLQVAAGFDPGDLVGHDRHLPVAVQRAVLNICARLACQAVHRQHRADGLARGIEQRRGARACLVAQRRSKLRGLCRTYLDVTSRLDRRSGHAGCDRAVRIDVADLAARQGIDCHREEVARRPADGVERQHHPGATGPGLHHALVRGLQRRGVLRLHHHVADLGLDCAAQQLRCGTTENFVHRDRAVDRQAHARAEGAAAGTAGVAVEIGTQTGGGHRRQRYAARTQVRHLADLGPRTALHDVAHDNPADGDRVGTAEVAERRSGPGPQDLLPQVLVGIVLGLGRERAAHPHVAIDPARGRTVDDLDPVTENHGAGRPVAGVELGRGALFERLREAVQISGFAQAERGHRHPEGSRQIVLEGGPCVGIEDTAPVGRHTPMHLQEADATIIGRRGIRHEPCIRQDDGFIPCIDHEITVHPGSPGDRGLLQQRPRLTVHPVARHHPTRSHPGRADDRHRGRFRQVADGGVHTQRLHCLDGHVAADLQRGARDPGRHAGGFAWLPAVARQGVQRGRQEPVQAGADGIEGHGCADRAAAATGVRRPGFRASVDRSRVVGRDLDIARGDELAVDHLGHQGAGDLVQGHHPAERERLAWQRRVEGAVVTHHLRAGACRDFLFVARIDNDTAGLDVASQDLGLDAAVDHIAGQGLAQRQPGGDDREVQVQVGGACAVAALVQRLDAQVRAGVAAVLQAGVDIARDLLRHCFRPAEVLGIMAGQEGQCLRVDLRMGQRRLGAVAGIQRVHAHE